ncbi:MAG: cell division protein FtsZ [Candidatus Pacearchaeota archaeon]
MAYIWSKETRSINDFDKELEELVKNQVARIKIIGIGGAGGNTISRIKEVGIKGGEIIAINTDAQDLLYTSADYKILIGREISKGLGAGSNPRIGAEAAKEQAQEIKKKLEGAEMVFITCGLGGGTGSGAAPIIADLAKKSGALTIGVVTLPFSVEGKKRIENAMEALEKLESIVDTLIVIPNDKLLEIAPDMPLPLSFKIADEILTNAVKGITDLITKAGLVNLDFADVKAVMTNGGVSLISIGEDDSGNRAIEATQRALNNPLLEVDISNGAGALINVSGGENLTLEEYKKVIEIIGSKLSPEAKIISGAQISKDLENTLRVMVIITGVKSNQIRGEKKSPEERKRDDLTRELGIENLEEE